MTMYKEDLQCPECGENLECGNCGSEVVRVTVREGYPDGRTETEVYLEARSDDV